MENQMLSQSEMTDSRDPFQQAKKQFNSKKNSTMLSSSPMQTPVDMADQIPAPDMNKILSGMGVEVPDLQMNPMGRFQLAKGLQSKFGDNYTQNPDALKALTAFDDNLKQLGDSKVQANMNRSLENANRTLGMLLRGQGE